MENYDEKMLIFIEKLKNELISDDEKMEIHYLRVEVEMLDDNGLDVEKYIFYTEQMYYCGLESFENFRNLCEQHDFSERILIAENNMQYLYRK